MRRVFVLILVLAAAGPVAGHGSTTPPPEPDPPPPTLPYPDEPPNPPTWDPEKPGGPTTPPPSPPPAPAPPQPPPPAPPESKSPRPEILTRRRTASAGDGWRIWWEYNREHLLGLRRRVRDQVVITGTASGPTDPLGDRRPEVVAALRETARGDDERLVRAAALIALGRVGGDEDARLCVETIAAGHEPADVREAAAVALGLLPPFADEEVREKVRTFLVHVLRHPATLPGRVAGMTVCAAGLRAASDPLLRMALVGRLAEGTADDGEEAAHLAFAAGLAGDPIAAPELVRAVRKGELAGADLTDTHRALAVTALGRVAGPTAVDPLVSIMGSRRTSLNTKRAAVLALGRLLREAPLEPEAAERAARAIRDVFDDENDTILRGFAAVALGGGRPPHALPLLMEALDRGGNAAVKPYCAVALGLAARTTGGDEAERIGRFLRGELDKTRHFELAAALSLALGLARALEAEGDLIVQLRRDSLPAAARGVAAQGLGLLGSTSPEAIEALREAAQVGVPGLLEDAALGLGLLGHRGVARDLAATLPRAGSSHAQARLMLALSYLAHTESVAPLLEVLRNSQEPPAAREFAAVALGLLGVTRSEDPLFALDAWLNFHATTRATNELVRLY